MLKVDFYSIIIGMKLVCRVVFLFFVFISILINTTFAGEYNCSSKAAFAGAYIYSADYLNEDIINNENNKPVSNLTNRDSRVSSSGVKNEANSNSPYNLHMILQKKHFQKFLSYIHGRTYLKNTHKLHFIAHLSQIFPQAP